MDAFDQIMTAAAASDLQQTYDSGPGYSGRLIAFGDPTHAQDWLNGSGRAGTRIQVSFTATGAVESAERAVNDQTESRTTPGAAPDLCLAQALALLTP
ncbi:hypothetical protein [Gordonia malaquae]|uniref:hypothetical protein n=1 Tax=Gordonia malaquae TaxID=410332 RepID=UPI0030194655